MICYSVRLDSLVSISDKAYLATSFDGSECVLPKSMVFGRDHEVQKSEAYWIAAWILEKKDIQYSTKKKAWFDDKTGNVRQWIEITKHVPTKIETTNINPDKELKR